jgi:nucleoside phosphorylase
METFAVAEVAAEAGLPCLAVRVISDNAHETLPGEVASLSAPQSPLRRLGAVVGAVGRRPAAAGRGAAGDPARAPGSDTKKVRHP